MSMSIEAENNNQTYWLPPEPEEVYGINESPVVLVSTILGPDVLIQITYLALCWLTFSTYIDAHEHDYFFMRLYRSFKNSSKGSMIFWGLTIILVIVHIILITLYLAGKI